MLTLFCGEGPVRDYDDASRCDTARFGALFRHLLAQGIYLPPSQFECLFVSTAHGGTEVDATVAAVERSSSDDGLRLRGRSARARARRACSGSERSSRGTSVVMRRCSRTRSGAGARSRTRDDLRGLSPPLRAVTSLRAARPGHRPPARRHAPCPRPRARRRSWVMSPPWGDLAELLSLCAQARAEGRGGDGEAWAATAAYLGRGGLGEARAAFRDDRDPGPLGEAARDRVGPERLEAALARHAHWMAVPLPA